VGAVVEAAGFTLEQRIPSGLPLVVADLGAVTQCLQNLIGNGIKYSGESRWIGISAKVVETKGVHTEVQISIHDRGVGISDAELPNIFKPFYRSPIAVAAQIHGTGLGLAVAKTIAESMRGSLSVVSQVAVGSTFTLHLPCAVEPEEKNTAVRGSELLVGVGQ
jgi:signal transduction histidine kinase